MAMKKKSGDYKELARSVLAGVGGASNVEKVIHCVTRLRFYLKDRSLADKAGLESLEGVMG